METVALLSLTHLCDQLSSILGGLRRVVAVWGTRGSLMTWDAYRYHWWLGRKLRAFQRLVAALQAGETAREHPSQAGLPKSNPNGRKRAVCEPLPPDGVRMPLPRGRAWLARRLGAWCGTYPGLFFYLMQSPEMLALLKAEPRARRMLRPVFRALVTGPLPDWLMEPAKVLVEVAEVQAVVAVPPDVDPSRVELRRWAEAPTLRESVVVAPVVRQPGNG